MSVHILYPFAKREREQMLSRDAQSVTIDGQKHEMYYGKRGV